MSIKEQVLKEVGGWEEDYISFDDYRDRIIDLTIRKTKEQILKDIMELQPSTYLDFVEKAKIKELLEPKKEHPQK